ncbi:MAG: ATP-binding protein [Cellulomonadaceae bacterium]|nr:ATP-binding protein [Cellulomonadaceae bacterium]
MKAGSDSFMLVGFDGQHYVARIGSFVLIPIQVAYVVAEVVGLRDRELSSAERPVSEVEDSLALKSAKFLDVVPVGTLPLRDDEPFRFGVSVYPPLYSEVLYTQTSDLDRILEVAGAEQLIDPAAPDGPTSLRAFDIGTSVVFDNYEVKVRVDEFFGGHAAVLGNTGSGKSCTVAAILQSVLGKTTAHAAAGASFVIFDTNGEYRQALTGLPEPIGKHYTLVPGSGAVGLAQVPGPGETTDVFQLPHWLLSADEWDLLLRASDRAQRPVLRTALGLTSLFAAGAPSVGPVKNHVLAHAITSLLRESENDTASAAKIRGLLLHFSTLEISRQTVDPTLAMSYGKFTRADVLLGLLEPHTQTSFNLPDYTNLPFSFDALGEALELAVLYEEAHGNTRIRDYCAPLITRYKSVKDRAEFAFMRSTPAVGGGPGTPEDFTNRLLGLRATTDGRYSKVSQVTVVDMNDVEDEVVEVVAAVCTRLIFERLRRAPERNTMPVNLVLEEAHRYISERPSEYALDAARIFSRVAKEGRKYGLSVMLASQRPSELSRTVLSQCSNFVIHRIQNPEDLQHVRRMTPFISEAVLSRLPSLPKQHALIFGNSVSVPTTFRVRDADPTPRSDDARVREAWFQENPTFGPV